MNFTAVPEMNDKRLYLNKLRELDCPKKTQENKFLHVLPEVYPTVSPYAGGSGLEGGEAIPNQCTNCGIFGHLREECLEPAAAAATSAEFWRAGKQAYRQQDGGRIYQTTLERQNMRKQWRQAGLSVNYQLLKLFIEKSIDEIMEMEETTQFEHFKQEGFSQEEAKQNLNALLLRVKEIDNVAIGFIRCPEQMNKLNMEEADILRYKVEHLKLARDNLAGRLFGLLKALRLYQ